MPPTPDLYPEEPEEVFILEVITDVGRLFRASTEVIFANFSASCFSSAIICCDIIDIGSIVVLDGGNPAELRLDAFVFGI